MGKPLRPYNYAHAYRFTLYTPIAVFHKYFDDRNTFCKCKDTNAAKLQDSATNTAERLIDNVGLYTEQYL